MKKYLIKFAAALVLAGGFMTSAHATPVTINMTADNVIADGGLCDTASCTSFSSWATLGSGSMGNWKQSDSLTLNLGAGTYSFAWQVTNFGGASKGNPAALLAEVLWAGGSNYSSSSWEVFEQQGQQAGTFVENATEYGLNGGANIWTDNNGGVPVAGISTKANWIYTLNNFADVDSSAWIRTSITVAAVSVPEPGILGLFGLGLIGLTMVRRKRAA